MAQADNEVVTSFLRSLFRLSQLKFSFLSVGVGGKISSTLTEAEGRKTLLCASKNIFLD
jgi:hypothetical protein